MNVGIQNDRSLFLILNKQQGKLSLDKAKQLVFYLPFVLCNKNKKKE